MIFELYRTSNPYNIEVVEISTLEELKELQIKGNDKLIIDFLGETIEIYDDYRE